MTDTSKEPPKSLESDFKPACAGDCGMEQAYNLGFLSGPSPEQPKVRPNEMVRSYE